MVKNIALNKEKSLQRVFLGAWWCFGRGERGAFYLYSDVAVGWCGIVVCGVQLCFLCFFIAFFLF